MNWEWMAWVPPSLGTEEGGSCPSVSSLPVRGHQRKFKLWSSWGQLPSLGSKVHRVHGGGWEPGVCGSFGAIKPAGATTARPAEAHLLLEAPRASQQLCCTLLFFCVVEDLLISKFGCLLLVWLLFKSVIHKVKHFMKNKKVPHGNSFSPQRQHCCLFLSYPSRGFYAYIPVYVHIFK